MTRGINKVILVGNLGGDPDTKYANSGTAITTLNIATSESWNDKQSGEKQERTEWHRVKLFGKLGEIAGEYLKKGRQVYIEGSLRTDKYTDKEGVERYTTYIVANEMQMLGGDKEHQGSRGGDSRGNDHPPARGQQSQQSRTNSSQGRNNQSQSQGGYGQHADNSFGSGPMEDDIPFSPLSRRSHL